MKADNERLWSDEVKERRQELEAAARRSQEEYGYMTAAEQRRARLNEEIRQMLSPAEYAAAAANDQDAIGYVESNHGEAAAAIEQDSREQPLSLTASAVRAELPDPANQTADIAADAPANECLDPFEARAAKAAEIDARTYIEREFGIDAELYGSDHAALERELSRKRAEGSDR